MTIRFFPALHLLKIVRLLSIPPEIITLQITFEIIALPCIWICLILVEVLWLFIFVSASTITEARARKSYDFKFKKAVIKHAEETAIKKQLGNIQSRKLRLRLVDGFYLLLVWSKLRFLIEGGFSSRAV